MDSKQKKRQTIQEWVLSRKPNFDPNKHRVLINDLPIDESKFCKPVLPLDKISIKSLE